MYKYLFKEVSPKSCDFSWYFDGDCFDEKSGDYNNTLFILYYDRSSYTGINAKEYKNLSDKIYSLFEEFEEVENGYTDYDGKKITYKNCMENNGIKYTSTMCHRLKLLYATYNGDIDCSLVAAYLRIVTGKEWRETSVSGYCQGDYVNIIYCSDNYTEQSAEEAGNVYLGCAKEFSCTDYDENGQLDENTTCYGYIVADNQAFTDEEYKNVLASYQGVKPDEIKLEMIDYDKPTYTRVTYSYKEV